MGDRHLHSKVISDLGGLGWSFGHAYYYGRIHIFKSHPEIFFRPDNYVCTSPMHRVFFLGGGGGWGTGGPPIRRKFCQSPHLTLVPVFGPRLVPPSRGSSPKIRKFKYILVSNLTTFQLKSTLKSCISCLK